MGTKMKVKVQSDEELLKDVPEGARKAVSAAPYIKMLLTLGLAMVALLIINTVIFLAGFIPFVQCSEKVTAEVVGYKMFDEESTAKAAVYQYEYNGTVHKSNFTIFTDRELPAVGETAAIRIDPDHPNKIFTADEKKFGMWSYVMTAVIIILCVLELAVMVAKVRAAGNPDSPALSVRLVQKLGIDTRHIVVGAVVIFLLEALV